VGGRPTIDPGSAPRFAVDGDLVDLRPLGHGHIHDTRLATYRTPAGDEVRLVHQRINVGVFADPQRLLDNVARVTAHLGVPEPVAAAGGGRFWRDADGGLWRAYRYIEGVTHDRFERPAQARSAAAAFARLAAALAGLPGPALAEPIAGFHDFGARLATFRRAVAAAAADGDRRAEDCGAEIEAVERASWLVGALADSRAAGHLPVRTVHNDAKAGNVVFDGDPVAGDTVIAILDLDTVAPGTVLFDVGDLVRSGASTHPEDGEPASVGVRPDLVAAIMDGYMSAVPGLLTDGERDLLPLAGPLMTFEAAMRFLTDHLQGDVYFRVDAPGHNLARARSQLALLDRLLALPGVSA
jgi:Ser/Thr protein kinase RdoA (MazF antagonist)